ncbi:MULTISPECIES: LysR family transcriptional regulator [Caproicibacterium]|uniref:LysR family transcriptional regulator n=1 Tax=Caproicibacterium argilliputei TaxID=3030016 RepID=A0AA97D8K3_9FIRM|nr:LysR family transcriptional regulator [Caproicibacterium argilliputei]WOC31462.1 LysR family transcriptional regulator [Caproicibacterium argilliputei]
MTLQQLRYISKIVNCGSMNEAAKQLYIAQSTLSSSVKELEKELKIEIFYRSAHGISLTAEGAEFLSYARQILEQTELLEQRYLNRPPQKQLCAVSTQHYAFAVEAFVAMIRETDAAEYKFTLRETRTHDILEDVSTLRSEIGILYLNTFNRSVMTKLFQEMHLQFQPLFLAQPHVFVSSRHPLAGRQSVTLEDLKPYPCLSFEQGAYNSFYFSEEILSTEAHAKSIAVSDRATLFNLLIGLNGYTICTGVLNRNLNGDNIVSVPLQAEDSMQVGWIYNKKARLSVAAQRYLQKLKEILEQDGFAVLS